MQKMEVDSEKEIVIFLNWLLPLVPQLFIFIVGLMNNYFNYILLISMILWFLVFGMLFYKLHASFKIYENGFKFEGFNEEVYIQFSSILYLEEEKRINKPLSLNIYKLVLKDGIKISRKFKIIRNRKFQNQLNKLQGKVKIKRKLILD